MKVVAVKRVAKNPCPARYRALAAFLRAGFRPAPPVTRTSSSTQKLRAPGVPARGLASESGPTERIHHEWLHGGEAAAEVNVG